MKYINGWSALLVFVVIHVTTECTTAQVPGIGRRPVQRQVFCDFGQAMPACDVFPIAEFGYNLGAERSPYFQFGLGLVKNITPNLGVGASAALGFGRGYLLTLQPRVRWWLVPTVGIDLIPGFVLDHDQGSTPSWSGQAGINFGDRLAFVVQYDYLRRDGGAGASYAKAVYAGVRLGLGGYVVRGLRGSDTTECDERGGRCPGEPPVRERP